MELEAVQNILLKEEEIIRKKNGMVICPYVRTHYIPISKLKKHLEKCRKEIPKLVRCKYNATHLTPERELECHHLICSDRYIFEMPPMEEIIRVKDGTVFCPYQQTHDVSIFRLEKHLEKCRQKYPISNLVSCKYNITHLIPEPELRHHHLICSDRYKFEMPPNEEEITDADQHHFNIPVSKEELLDDYNFQLNNPQDYCKKKKVGFKVTSGKELRRKQGQVRRQRMKRRHHVEKSKLVSTPNVSYKERKRSTGICQLLSSIFAQVRTVLWKLFNYISKKIKKASRVLTCLLRRFT